MSQDAVDLLELQPQRDAAAAEPGERNCDKKPLRGLSYISTIFFSSSPRTPLIHKA